METRDGQTNGLEPNTEEPRATREVAYKDATQEVLSDARGLSREVAQKAAEQAREVAKQVQQQGLGALEGGKVQLAEQIYGVAKALRRGSEQFRTDDLGGLADLSDDLAEQADAVQRYLKERRGDALLRDLKTFATERRALFVGSLFVTGLLAVRFMGASKTARSGSPGSRAQAARRAPASASPTVVTRGGVRSYPKAEGQP